MTETVADRILSYITEQGMGPGDKLPAEIEMSRILGFSRNSMREAYSDLIAKSVIERRHGVGTFVADPPIYNSIGVTFGFWRMIELADMRPSLTEVFRDHVEADAALQKRLETTATAPIGRLRWLFKANETPCVLIDHYLAPGIPLDAIGNDNVFNVLPPLTSYIETKGATLETVNTAAGATAEVAEHLDVEPNRALMRSYATIRGGGGKVALFSDAWMSSDLIASRTVTELSPLDFR